MQNSMESNMKILIVEDDFVVRQGIRFSLEWEAYGLSICGDAANGKLGLELADQLNPDIIITDIRMPIMDGLEFTERLLHRKSKTKIIILSGYDDFAYAKKAIRLGVYDYLLKPIDADELLKCICRVRDEILEAEEKQRHQEKQDILVKAYKAELFDQVMGKLIRPTFAEQKEEVLKELSACGVRLDGAVYKVLVLVLENFLLLTRNHSGKEKRYLIELVREKVNQVFGGSCRVWCFMNSSSQFVILLEYESVSRLYLEEGYQKLMNAVTVEAGFLCTISCGLEKRKIEEIHSSYQEAICALRRHVSRTENNVFQYTDEQIGDGAGFLEIQEEERQLINDIQEYDTGSIEKHMNAIFRKAVEEREPYEKVNSTCVRLASAVFSVMDEMGLHLQKEFYTYQETLAAIQQYHSVSNLKSFMTAFLGTVSSLLEKAEKKKYSSVVDEAVTYVQKNFKNEISVKSISAELFITPNYFSQIFKSQMGMNFIDYLNEVRIGYAKTLLRDRNLKVYEVAEQSGYQNYKYFNIVWY